MKRLSIVIAAALKARSIYREAQLSTLFRECREGPFYPAIPASILKMRIEFAPVI